MRQSQLALLGLLGLMLLGAAPSRTQTYVSGQVIDPADVTENEDNIYSYLQAGVDTIRDGAIVTADFADGAVTSAKVATDTLTASNLASSSVGTSELTDASIAAADLASDAVTEAKLKVVDSPADEEFLTYESTTGDFEWQTLTVADRVHRTAGNVAITASSLTDLTGASITLTTGANPVLIGFAFTYTSDNAADIVNYNVDVDGTDVLGDIGLRFHIATVSEALNGSFVLQTADLTAGSHTFKVQWYNNNSASATTICSSDTPCNFWVAEVID